MASVTVPRIAGNVRKIDFLMGAARDLPVRPEGAAFRYALCSTPRCGSNLVGDMLRETGLAGDPVEYLNTRYIAGFVRQRTGKSAIDVNAYQAALEKVRTSPNGVFGTKIHEDHLQNLWPDRPANALKFLGRFDKFVLLTRRDKIAQAVSFHRARMTQIWSSLDYDFLDEDDPRLKIEPHFDAALISECLLDLAQQETGWRRLFEANPLPYIEVVYEDFVADYVGQSRRVLAWLGIDPDNAAVKAPRLQRQGADSDPLVAQFREFLGLSK